MRDIDPHVDRYTDTGSSSSYNSRIVSVLRDFFHFFAIAARCQLALVVAHETLVQVFSATFSRFGNSSDDE
jgi:hypothetical protein